MSVLEAMSQGRPVVAPASAACRTSSRAAARSRAPGDDHGARDGRGDAAAQPGAGLAAGPARARRLGRLFNEGACVEGYRDLLRVRRLPRTGGAAGERRGCAGRGAARAPAAGHARGRRRARGVGRGAGPARARRGARADAAHASRAAASAARRCRARRARRGCCWRARRSSSTVAAIALWATPLADDLGGGRGRARAACWRCRSRSRCSGAAGRCLAAPTGRRAGAGRRTLAVGGVVLVGRPRCGPAAALAGLADAHVDGRDVLIRRGWPAAYARSARARDGGAAGRAGRARGSSRPRRRRSSRCAWRRPCGSAACPGRWSGVPWPA